MENAQTVQYAGFWRRVYAYIIDGLILQVIITFATTAYFLFGHAESSPPRWIGALAIVILYFTLQESSPWQASVGKIVSGTRVVSQDGGRIGFLRALARTLAKILSALPFFTGFLLPAFTRRRQALHDMVAGTTVISTGKCYYNHIVFGLVIINTRGCPR